MSTKTKKAGTEVDGYCTNCKLDLTHLIVAMTGDKVARVECLTCHTQHNYYKPKTAKPAAPRAKKRSSAAAKEPKPKSAAALKKSWEQATSGRSAGDYSKYEIGLTFLAGELVKHKKFGDGVVSEVLEGSKVSVLFEDGEKLLVHART
ncbi:MAG: hypothetical protein EXR75_15765 [Myxococcales bacterium]|nr:hypothetical protein [Myxococcales bacterium]